MSKLFYHKFNKLSSYDMDTLTLYEEYRFVEKNDVEVNAIWKGAHLLLFFLAFVFGSFCTFCFHMLMYLFDEKCVLFPKLLSLTSLRQNIIYEFIPDKKEIADMLPVDFLSTQWVEKSACLLPTYVPLVSGIFGLVWTTMFLMCSTGSRVLTGLERPWRVLPAVFLFSLAMGGLCVYTSTVTHYGLQELCLQLSEITGSPTCTYTINVATLAYERRIRGVYQATRLTILSAWLHTSCWVLSALLAVIRVVLAVDFKLIKVSVQLRGNIDRMLEQHERHIHTVSAETLEVNHPYNPVQYSRSRIHIHFKKKEFRRNSPTNNYNNTTVAMKDDGDLLYYSGLTEQKSEPSLVAIERSKLDQKIACNAVAKEHRFIVRIIFNLIDTIDSSPGIASLGSQETLSDTTPIIRQYGQQRISSTIKQGYQGSAKDITRIDLQEAERIALNIKHHLQTKIKNKLSDLKMIEHSLPKNASIKSSMNISSDMRIALKKREDSLETSPDDNVPNTSRTNKNKIKSNSKQVGIQTDEKEQPLKVQIESRMFNERGTKENKETQTKKEKQE